MNAEQFARQMARRQRLFDTEFRKTMRGIGISARTYCRELLTNEIYALPEDVNPKTGKKKWTRTRKLIEGEKYEVRGPYEVAIVNATPYGVARHEAGKPGRRSINPLRVSHWRDELVKTFRSIVVDAIQLTLRDIYRRL